MLTTLTKEEIVRRLEAAYQPGVIASTDWAAGLPEHGSLKCAAVLIPFVWWEQEWQIVFTRRAETVEHHKGQVSFPGGGCEVGESTPEMTALREAKEEIGLEPADVLLLGRLNDFVTISRYQVTPVVGVMPWPYPVQMERAEVARIFTIPLAWLARRANWDEQSFTPEGLARPVPVLRYHPYDGETLWGISARIMHNLLIVLELHE